MNPGRSFSGARAKRLVRDAADVLRGSVRRRGASRRCVHAGSRLRVGQRLQTGRRGGRHPVRETRRYIAGADLGPLRPRHLTRVCMHVRSHRRAQCSWQQVVHASANRGLHKRRQTIAAGVRDGVGLRQRAAPIPGAPRAGRRWTVRSLRRWRARTMSNAAGCVRDPRRAFMFATPTHRELHSSRGNQRAQNTPASPKTSKMTIERSSAPLRLSSFEVKSSMIEATIRANDYTVQYVRVY